MLSPVFASEGSAYDELQILTVIDRLFPEATEIREPLEQPKAWSIYQVTELIGYAFLSKDYAPLPGFSGAPYQVVVGIDRNGIYRGAEVIEQHEPIFLHGLGTEPMHLFTEQYPGLDIRKPIKLTSASVRDKASGSNIYIDGITKATISAVVLNESIMLSALRVAEGTGILPYRKPPSLANPDLYEPASWRELISKGLIQKFELSLDDVNSRFAADLDLPFDGERFIKLTASYLNTPTTGQNILGESIYERLMGEKLGAGEHAFLIANEGPFSILGDAFTPGTPSDRLALQQGGIQFELRDLDFFSVVPLPDFERLQTEGMPNFDEFRIFRIQAGNGFDPSSPYELSIVVSREFNPIVTPEVQIFSSAIELPKQLFIEQNREESKPAIWRGIWESRLRDITLLGIGLLALTLIIFNHRWFTSNARRFRIMRWGFLLYTIVFIGYLTQAQLSITNIFPVIRVITGDVSAEVLLLDPIIFLLWCYVLLTLVIWGRGYFCGWLCPFGIYQEIIGELAKLLKVKQLKIPFATHRRLWLVKYLILALLIGLSFWSITTAERAAEVEPFKTAVTLHFFREYPFVVYAVALLIASLFVHKLFCRYLCPLGALLSVLGYFPIFKWLPRRDECGSPCKLCNRKCGIAAIEPSGAINYRECIQCYDCEVIYRDSKQCVPLINAAKGKRKLKVRQL